MAKKSRWSLMRVRGCARSAAEKAGIVVAHVDAHWLGEWSSPRSGEGPDFRCASVVIRDAAGRSAKKAFVAERDGAWEIR
jgi:hypothetical protein